MNTLLIKTLILVAVVGIGASVFVNLYGDAAFFSYAKSTVSSEWEKSKEDCLPQNYVGNKYFKIKTPSGFCDCLDDGRDAISQSKESGESLSELDFTSMCIDVFYKASFATECQKINNMLRKAKKKSRLVCGCFVGKVNSLLSYTIVNDFDMEMQVSVSMDALDPKTMGKGLDSIKAKLAIDRGSDRKGTYVIPQGVVTSCIKVDEYDGK
ncbi:MAG: hypothetical protein COB14_04445 [Alphaproteobacteria bacterium]|nr:MAG: hypothetical protein COB14_04445 [Alphaproteobacteria bacterium]